MFAGHDGSNQLNDFYSFDFETEMWTHVNQGNLNPSPRDSHISVIFNNSLFIFGGSTGPFSNPYSDFYEYKFEEQRWYLYLILVNINNNIKIIN